jgi:hypothetical protein
MWYNNDDFQFCVKDKMKKNPSSLVNKICPMNEFQYVNEMQMAKELWTQQGIASFICVVALANSLNRTKNKLMFWLSQNFIYHYMYDSQIYSGTFVGEIGKLESLRNWERYRIILLLQKVSVLE